MVIYEVPRGRQAQCPVCKAEDDVDQLRQALLEARNLLERQTNELNRLRPLVDLITAMRQALEVLGPEDRMFMKSVAYRFRAGETISLQVFARSQRGKRRPSSTNSEPIGFVAVTRTGNERHECSSLGGLAMAEYVRDSLTTVGPITTMQHLMRAMSNELTPAGGP